MFANLRAWFLRQKSEFQLFIAFVVLATLIAFLARL